MMRYEIFCDNEDCAESVSDTSILSLSKRLYDKKWDVGEVKGWNGQHVKSAHYCPEHAER